MAGSSTPRPSVLVFATGGTIGMRATDKGLAPDPDFPEVLDALVAEIAAPLGVDWRVNHLLPSIDSANADAGTAPRIARAVRARVRTQRPRGVVILHGTDTLAFAAARLAFELSDLAVPVVVTGSQLPHGDPDTDATANLTLAMRTALRAAPGSPVSVAFGGSILPAVRATKHSSVALEAFRAELPLAPSPAGVPQVPGGQDARDPARVLAYSFVPATIAADLRAATGGHPDGLILECYGSGNAPMGRPGMLGVLREICAEMPVVAISQCTTGGVDLHRYAVGHELAAAGVIDGGDLTMEAATAKLGYLIDHGFSGAELAEQLRRNLVGERIGR
ncbi:asparaginase domain-containing protein [Leucobacter rhizosphaerae]|uniref:asparaginase n=1 Tax=Leucobacter rhizosphaerae TaxID=2932245 RepID=A0ABY4FYF7_9MICO|nr:asparaginase domain-containing protein [Leucobacter rhizosphaerae]UOQ61331.1 asparaginase domain-containing protein [Leucobacter rhizosphaerae]